MASVPATTEAPQQRVPVTTGGKVSAFVPTTMEEAWRLSTALASSGMTPKAYGNDPNKVMVGIMAGAEVGLTPFAALQSIAVIGNNPSLWGDGALALVQASGLLEDMEETDDGAAATCRVVRAGRTTPIVRTFSVDDAKKAGLAGKSGPWTQYPARMRQMRARAFALRDGFPDVLKGLHIAEEVRDYAPMGGGEALPSAEPLRAEHLLEQAKPAAQIAETAPADPAAIDQGGEGDEDFRVNEPEGPADEPAPADEPSEEPEDPATAFVDQLRASIDGATTLAELKKADGEWTRNRVAYDDQPVQAEIDELLTAAFRRVRDGEGG